MLNDPIANMLSKIINYEAIGRNQALIAPAGNLAKQILDIMNKNGYVGVFEEKSPSRGGVLNLHLLGKINRCGVIKPRFAVRKATYEKFEKRYLPAKHVGILIVSTPKGLMTHQEAKKNGYGGRLVAYCY